MDDQIRIELEAAAFRSLVTHLKKTLRCSEYRSYELSRILSQLPIKMVSGS